MDAAPLVRLRWRLRGAWLWPSFFVLSFADAAIIHGLPPSGDSAGLVGAWVVSAVLSLLGIALFSRALGVVIRRLHPDMPRVVARDYAGTVVAFAFTFAFLAAGLIHHHTIAADQRAVQDASARAEAYIGAHAPPAFQTNLRTLDIYEVQVPLIYRICAADITRTHYYCVVVKRSQPFGRSVHYSGSEPNSLLSQGTG